LLCNESKNGAKASDSYELQSFILESDALDPLINLMALNVLIGNAYEALIYTPKSQLWRDKKLYALCL